jgi:hypothetical protein
MLSEMKNNPEYRVFPRKPTKVQDIVFSTYQRRETSGIGGGGCFVGIIIFIATNVIVQYNYCNPFPCGPGPGLGKEAIPIGFFLGLLCAAIVMGICHFILKETNISQAEQRATRDSQWYEDNRVKEEAESLSEKITNIYQTSLELRTELPEYLEEVDGWLDKAEEEYEANAFAPFWDAVEEAAIWLGYFNDDANEIAKNANNYYQNLNGVKHTFPVFPIRLQTIPDASPQIERLRRVVRMGQTNFQFANIWEHRKTREVMIAGFCTLNEVIYHLGSRIEDSISSLKESISSDIANLVEEQIKTRESIDKIGKNLDARTLEQNRMLDNIQHGRKPKPKDTPTKK